MKKIYLIEIIINGYIKTQILVTIIDILLKLLLDLSV